MRVTVYGRIALPAAVSYDETRSVALFNVRLSDDLAHRFDAWAADRGGRSAALRVLIAQTCAKAPWRAPRPATTTGRPVKLTVRLSAEDARGLQCAAAQMGLTPNAWAAALVRRRLSGRPTFRPDDARTLLTIQTEFRRIGVNVNQIARALNTAVVEGEVLTLELDYLGALHTELRGHARALRATLQGTQAYWDLDD